MSVTAGIEKYYELAGIRGVLSILAFRAVGYPKELKVTSTSLTKPISLRMRTSDEMVFFEIIRGEYDFDLGFCPKVIIDAGANIGMTSIYFANKYPTATVVAIEPEASNFNILRKNTGLYPKIIPVQAALWNHDGQIAVGDRSSQGNWAFVAGENTKGPRVRAVTLKTLIDELKLPSIDLAKIDIEGAEMELFEDISWISGVRCIMIELHEDLRPGCTALVTKSLDGFERVHKGATTFFSRP